MKRKTIKTLILLSSLTLLPVLSLTSCGEETTIKKDDKLFDQVKFEDKSVEYDGNFHTISPVNLPKDTTIKYVGESSFKEIGSYKIKVELSKNGYRTTILEANLRITKPLIKGLTIQENKEVIYDGSNHGKDIKIQGIIPENAVVTGPVIVKDNKEVNEAINVGEYTIKYRVSLENHQDLYLKSTLVIKGKQFELVNLNTTKKEVAYDGEDHINDISVLKPLNPNAKVTKLVVNDKNEKVSTVTEIGTYKFTFVVRENNYQDKILEGQLIIFDGSTLVNRKNKIVTYEIKDKTNKYNTNMLFLDLHNNATINLLNRKTGESTILVDETIQDYTVAGDELFVKDKNGILKYGKIGSNYSEFVEFPDKLANLDFIKVQRKHLIYTRKNTETNLTEICKFNSDSTSSVVASGKSIRNLKTEQNIVYYIENTGTLSSTIKSIAILDDMTGITSEVLSQDISNPIEFKIIDGTIYFVNNFLVSNTLYSYPLYGTNKAVKEILTVNGSSFEFDANGNELIYKVSSLTSKSGIFKHYLENTGTEDRILFDTEAANFNINSVTWLDDDIYFSNQNTMDCHLYKIASFGLTATPTLVK